MPLCKSIKFDVGSKGGAIGSGELSRSYGTDVSEVLPESFITGWFSTLDRIARLQADERVVDPRGGIEGDSMVQISPADELLRLEDMGRERA